MMSDSIFEYLLDQLREQYKAQCMRDVFGSLPDADVTESHAVVGEMAEPDGVKGKCISHGLASLGEGAKPIGDLWHRFGEGCAMRDVVQVQWDVSEDTVITKDAAGNEFQGLSGNYVLELKDDFKLNNECPKPPTEAHKLLDQLRKQLANLRKENEKLTADIVRRAPLDIYLNSIKTSIDAGYVMPAPNEVVLNRIFKLWGDCQK